MHKFIVPIGVTLIFGSTVEAANMDNLIKQVKDTLLSKPALSAEEKANYIDARKLSNKAFIKKASEKTDRLIIKVLPGTDINSIISIVSKKENTNVSKVKEFALKKPGVSIQSSPKIIVLKLDDADKIDQAIERIKQLPGVMNVEKDYIIQAQMLPNDPDYTQLWGMGKINAAEAWNGTIGSRDVVVGVIDTGVDYLHPDLKNNIWVNEKELNGQPGVDDDGNGYIDDIYGIDTYNGDSDPMDDNGHGTHVSGTIAAEGNNGIGVVGVNWQAKIVACKFLSADGYGYTSGAIECVNYLNTLKESGVNIVAVNNSWGGGSFSQELYDAFQIAGNDGIIHVCAAGNSSNDNDITPSYPASYDLDNIIAVAATDENDELAYFSNYGATSVDLAAPGVNVLSTLPSETFCNPTQSIYGIGFEAESSIDGWSFLSIDLSYPFQDIPELHWQRSDIEGYESVWSLDDSPQGNYVDNKLQSAVTRSFDLSEFNETAPGECLGLQFKIKGQNEKYFDGLAVFLTIDGENWEYYDFVDDDYNEWSTEGRKAINKELLTNNFKIGFVRFSDSSINKEGYKLDNLIIYKGIESREGRYGSYSGTSMATPHVTGAIALAASLYSDENVTVRRNRVLNAVDVLPSLQGKVATAGRLNLVKMLVGNIRGDTKVVSINQNWQTLDIFNYDDPLVKTPVVLAGPISYHGAQGCVVRLKDINTTNFSVRVQEWNYLDGSHVNEDIPLIILEPGRYVLSDGNVWEIGTFELSGTGSWGHVEFQQPFNEKPYLFLTVQTFNGPDAVVVRAKNVTTTGFDAALFEQQSLMGSPHAKETIGYLAIYAPDGNGTIESTLPYSLKHLEVNSAWTDTGLGFQLMLQEEQSADDETTHVYETVDVFHFIESDGTELFLSQDVSTKGYDPISIRYKK